MKNLKKVLALALAVIMVMSLFTVAFAAETETKLVASDFTDYAEIEYKDAVALCVDLGIISGIANGDGTYKFAPKDSIDRASWAKLVYFIATGDDNADAYKGANVGMTDISTSWAEGYIAYCVANGFAAGDGLGHFLPTNTTTVAAGLKTLLNVLGWDPDDRGYQGTLTWTGSVMTDAKAEGLMDDVAKENTALVNLTREVAAQIIYNALNAQTVEPVWGRDNGEKFVTEYKDENDGLPLLGLDKFSIVPVTATLNSVNSDGTGNFSITNPNGVTAPSLKGVKADASLCGESVTAYVKVNPKTKAFVETVSTAAVKAASVADYTFTNGVTLADVFFKNTTSDKTKAHFVGAPAATVTVYVNGDQKTITVTATTDGSGNITGYTIGGTDAAAVIAAANRIGCVVDVYTNSTGAVSMLKLTDWKIGTLNKDVETRTTKDGDLQVRIGALSTGWVNASLVSGWEGLEKDDVVLYYAGPNSTYVIEKAEKVTGSVTALKGTSELTINGEKYTQSTITGATLTLVSGWNVSGNKNNTYDFYLDKNGSLALSVLVEGEVETNVAFVLDSAWVTGSGVAGSNYAEAKLLFNDGTTEIVKIAKYSTDGTKANMKKIAAGADAATTWGTGSGAGFQVTAGKLSMIDNKFVTYSVNGDGDYEVCLTANERKTDVSETNKYNTTATAAAAGAITNQVKFDGSLVANNNTVFFVEKVDGDDTTYSIYTGYKNVPAMTNVAAGEAINDTNGIASYVYLKTTTGFNGEKPDGYIYVANGSDYVVNTDGNYVYNIYDAEGNEDTIVLNTSVNDGFYPIKSVGEKYTTLDAVVSVSKSLAKLGNGLIEITSFSPVAEFSYDDETVFVVVDMIKGSPATFDSCSSFSADSFELNTTDYTYVATAVGVSLTDNVADYVYVVRTTV